MSRALLALAAIALVSALALPAAAAAATAAPEFALDMYSNCFSVEVSGDFVWRDAAGVLKAQGTLGLVNDYFEWGYCSSAADVWVAPGDTIKIADGVTLRKYVVPNLTMAIDRLSSASGVASGTGPAGRTLRLCIVGFYQGVPDCRGVRIGQDGRWSFKGGIIGELVDIHWTSPNRDHIGISAYSPSFSVTLGKSTFTGSAGAPRRAVQVSVDGGLKATGVSVGDETGGFSGQLVDANGHPASIAVGDHVTSSIAANADFIVPNIEASADRFNDIVSGTCGDSGTGSDWVDVTVLHSGRERGWDYGYQNADGTFTIDFKDTWTGDRINIIRGDRIVVACQQTAGDFVQLKFAVK